MSYNANQYDARADEDIVDVLTARITAMAGRDCSM